MKKWNESKTIWFSILLAGFGAVEIALPGVREQIAPEYYGWITMAVAVICAALRVATSTGIER